MHSLERFQRTQWCVLSSGAVPSSHFEALLSVPCWPTVHYCKCACGHVMPGSAGGFCESGFVCLSTHFWQGHKSLTDQTDTHSNDPNWHIYPNTHTHTGEDRSALTLHTHICCLQLKCKKKKRQFKPVVYVQIATFDWFQWQILTFEPEKNRFYCRGPQGKVHILFEVAEKQTDDHIKRLVYNISMSEVITVPTC